MGGAFSDIDTSRCHFNYIPEYVVSVVNSPQHGVFKGSQLIAEPTTSGFRVYLWDSTSLSHRDRRDFDNYTVHWIGDTGSNTGRTVQGSTGWLQVCLNKFQNFGSNNSFVIVSRLKSTVPIFLYTWTRAKTVINSNHNISFLLSLTTPH
jgi:hypothetical protein